MREGGACARTCQMGRGTMYDDRLERKGATREVRRKGVSKRRGALSNKQVVPAWLDRYKIHMKARERRLYMK